MCELDKGVGGMESGIGWFAYESLAHLQAVHYLYELPSSAGVGVGDSLFPTSMIPQRCQSIIKY